MFRKLVDENKDIYRECSSTSRKNLLVTSIVMAVHHIGGRFIKKEGSTWTEVSKENAFTKTSQALRGTRNKSKTSMTTASTLENMPSIVECSHMDILYSSTEGLTAEDYLTSENVNLFYDNSSLNRVSPIPEYNEDCEDEDLNPLEPNGFISQSKAEFEHFCLGLVNIL